MKSMQFGSSIKYPLAQYAAVFGNGSEVHVKVLGVCGNWRLKNPLPSCRLKCTKIDKNDGNKICCKTKCRATDTSESKDNEPDPRVVVPQINDKSFLAMLHAIYKFTKVYTLQGMIVSVISVSLLAVQKLSDLNPTFFVGVFQAILAASLANSYIAGVNQLSDINIDRINKPHLPLVSGELSVKKAVQLTVLYAILCIWLGWSVTSLPLKLAILILFSFGTVYSVHIPFLRWKRDPVLVAICIWSFQGIAIPIFFHLHAQTSIHGRTVLLSKHAIFVSGIMSIYAIVASLFKDIPDVEGDKINGINSFASQYGKKKVFWICIWLLEMAYGVAILIGLSSTHFWIRLIMVIGHGIFGFVLWTNANLVDLESNEAIESFYLFIWKLYSMEYLLVPFLRF